MSKVFIYEFLFRGGESSKPNDDTWHVVLGRKTKAIDGSDTLELTTALTPARAAALGYPLSRILAELNTSAVESVGVLREQKEAAERERDDLAIEHGKLKGQLQKLFGPGH